MTRSRLLRALMAALAILALALTLVACGDDDDSSADTAADTAAATGGGDIPGRHHDRLDALSSSATPTRRSSTTA